MTAAAFLITNSLAGFGVASTTRFFGVTGGYSSSNATEIRSQHKIGVAGTLSNLYVNVNTNARSGSSTTFNVRNNAANAGTPSAMACVFTASTTGEIADTTNTASVSVADLLNLAIVLGTGTQQIAPAMCSVTFTASSGTAFAFSYNDANAGTTLSGTGPITDFMAFSGTNNGAATTLTEAQAQIQIPVAGTIKYLTMEVITNTRSTSSTVVTLRKNTANGNNTFTYTASTTGQKTDTSSTDSISAGDLVCVSPALGTGTGNFVITLTGVTFVSTNDGESAAVTASVPANTFTGATNLSTGLGGGIIPIGVNGSRGQLGTAVTGSKLWVDVITNTSTTNPTFALVLGGSNGNQVITITALTTGTFQDTTNSDSIGATTFANYSFANFTTGGVTISAISMKIVSGGSISLTPSAGSLLIAGNTPTMGFGLNPSAGSLTLSGNAPVLGLGINPSSGSLIITGNIPTLANNLGLSPASGTLIITGLAPTLSNNLGLSPGSGLLTITGGTPTVGFGLNPSSGSLVITGLAPSLANNLGLTPGSATLVISGNAPAIGFGLFPNAGSIALTGLAPSMAADLSLFPGAGSLTLTGLAPIMGFDLFPASGTLVITGLAPSMAAGLSLFPGAGALTLTGLAPALGLGLFPGAGALVITGVAPGVNQGTNLTPAAGTLVITGNPPILGISYFFSPPSGTLTITGVVPFGGVSYFLVPPSGSLALNGFAAHIKIRHVPIFFNPDYVFSFWESEIVDYVGYNPVSMQMFIQYRDDNQALYLNVDRLTLQRVIDLFNNNLDANNVLNGLRAV